MFHAPSFGDEDFELSTTTTTTTTPTSLRASISASDGGGGGQQTSTTTELLRHDDEDKSPTSPDTGCWSSPDVSGSPSSEVVEPARRGGGGACQPRFQPVADAAAAAGDSAGPDDGDAATCCLLKLPAPDEFHIPDIRYAAAAEFYRHQRHHPASSLTVAYAAPPPPPPPRYPPGGGGYGAMRRSGEPPCLLMDDGRLPLRCDRAPVYTSPVPAADYGGAPGAGGSVCYNGVAMCDNTNPANDMLLRHDTVRLVSALHSRAVLAPLLWRDQTSDWRGRSTLCPPENRL